MLKDKRKIIRFILVIISAIVFIYSAYQIITILYGYSQGSKTYDKLYTEFTTTDNTDLPGSEKVPMTVDFNSLLKQNNDVVGWLYCENTPINYPILQSTDNNYYLHRMINKENNRYGSIFMDYRSDSDLSSLNTVIYGHNMKNDAMFGTLTNYSEQSYYNKHPILWLLSPKQNYKIELIAGYVTDSESDAYNDFNDIDELKLHIKNSVNKSDFVSNADISKVDKIITLSTCSYEYSTARYVLIGVLSPENTD